MQLRFSLVGNVFWIIISNNHMDNQNDEKYDSYREGILGARNAAKYFFQVGVVEGKCFQYNGVQAVDNIQNIHCSI